MEVFVDGVGGGSLVEEWGRWIRMLYTGGWLPSSLLMMLVSNWLSMISVYISGRTAAQWSSLSHAVDGLWSMRHSSCMPLTAWKGYSCERFLEGCTLEGRITRSIHIPHKLTNALTSVPTHYVWTYTRISLPAHPPPPPQEVTWKDTPAIPDIAVIGMCSPQLLLHRSQSSGGHTGRVFMWVSVVRA